MKKEQEKQTNNNAGNAGNVASKTFEVLLNFVIGDYVDFNQTLAQETFGKGPYVVIEEPYEVKDQPYIKIKDELGNVGAFPCSVIEHVPRPHTDKEVLDRISKCLMAKDCKGCMYEKMEHDDCIGSLMLEVVGIAKKYMLEIEKLKRNPEGESECLSSSES